MLPEVVEAMAEASRLNDCPNHSIGRSMKTGKEDIAGLLKAVELYVRRDHVAEGLVWDRRVARVLETLEGLPGVQVRRQLPYGVGQQIPHAAITWDEAALGITCDTPSVYPLAIQGARGVASSERLRYNR